VVDAAINALPVAERFQTHLFAVKFDAFGLLMAVFLALEPRRLVSVWIRVKTYVDPAVDAYLGRGVTHRR